MRAQSLDGLISFFASHHAIRAETILNRADFVVKLIPGPKDLSPNCGVALRFEYARREEVLELLTQKMVKVDRVHEFQPRSDIWQQRLCDSPREKK